MKVTLGEEDCRTVSRCLRGLHYYFFKSHLRIPDTVSEERVLCMLLVLSSICDKILAYQPAQEGVPHTVKAGLGHYFMLKNSAPPPTPQNAEDFRQILAGSKLVRNFLESGAVDDISGYLNQTLRRNALDALRAAMPKTGKSLRQCRTDEIANRKALLSAAEMAACWAQYGPRTDTPAKQFKNALVRGKYLALLEDKTLIAALTGPSLYPALDSNGKRACVQLIEAAFPLMNEAQKQQIEQLTNGVMQDYRDQLFALRRRTHEGQYGLMDLFRVRDRNRLEQGLLDFGSALVRDKGLCFYINYDLSAVSLDELDGLGGVIDGLTNLLNRDFLQHGNRDWALWENDTFKIIWLISVVWFRKLFHEMQVPALSGAAQE